MKKDIASLNAKKLVAKMTLEEAASQLRFDSPAIERLGIPAYNWWNECLHGVARSGTATVFPQAIGLAAMFDDELLEKIGDSIATEARARYNTINAEGDRDIYKGLTMWSPNINIFRDPRWGRGHETYGEDPYLSGRLGRAFVRGLQGKGETYKVAACAKHFAVHSGPEDLRHQFDAAVSKKDMFETYLPAFEELVDEGVEAVMGAYNRVNGDPCCGSKILLRDILRDKWGFEGHVVSDCWAVRDFHEGHKVTSRPVESVKLALESGCDLNCGCTYEHVVNAVNEGLLSKEYVIRSAERLFTARYMLGLLGVGSEYDSIGYDKVECPEHIQLSLKAAHESCVLLKNDGILPLDTSKYKTIGVIGPNANSRIALMGNYYGTASRYITVLEGIQDYVGDSARVFYADGCHLYKDRTEPLAAAGDRLAEARVVAKNSDVVILVLGLDETLEGEERDEGNSCGSGDKANLLLPKVQRELAEQILALGKPVITVLMAGSAIDLQNCGESSDAILNVWYPGARGGKAVADILFGRVSPSGKLPVTFYKNEALEEIGAFTDYSMVNKTYRYYSGKPLYPFGFGLTYSDLFADKIRYESGKVFVTVRNSGSRDTEDVLELYIRDTASPYEVPQCRLCGFKRISLRAGESSEFMLEPGEKAFTVIDNDGERVNGSGSYRLWAGFCSPGELGEKLTGHPLMCIDIVR